jgi:hypothetical protein
MWDDERLIVTLPSCARLRLSWSVRDRIEERSVTYGEVAVSWAAINAALRLLIFDPVAEMAERVTPVLAGYLPSGSTLWPLLL